MINKQFIGDLFAGISELKRTVDVVAKSTDPIDTNDQYFSLVKNLSDTLKAEKDKFGLLLLRMQKRAIQAAINDKQAELAAIDTQINNYGKN